MIVQPVVDGSFYSTRQDFKSALNYVQQRRFCVQPNDGFEQQLKEFEPIYRARIESRPETRGGVMSGSKRSLEDDSDTEDGHTEVGVKCRVQDTGRGDEAMEQETH